MMIYLLKFFVPLSSLELWYCPIQAGCIHFYTFVYYNKHSDTMTAFIWVAVVFGIFLISMFRITQSAMHWVLSLQVRQSQSVTLIASPLVPSSDVELYGILPFTPTWFLIHMRRRLLFKCIFKVFVSKERFKHLKILTFCDTDMAKS